MKVSLIAFGRPADRLLLGSWSEAQNGPAKDDQRINTVRKLLIAAKKRLGPSGRQKLVWNESSVYCTVDSTVKHAFIVIVEEDKEESTRNSGGRFVEECSWRLLGALNRTITDDPVMSKKCDECLTAEGLSEELKDVFANLATEYGFLKMPERGGSRANKSSVLVSEKITASGFVGSVQSSQYGSTNQALDEDPKLAGLRNKVGGIKGQVKSNMDAMIRHLEDIDAAEEETALLLDDADDYEEVTGKVERYFCMKDMKMRAGLSIAACVLFALCLFLVCKSGRGLNAEDRDAA